MKLELPFSRQKYLTYEKDKHSWESIKNKYEIAQLKYDGIWCLCEVTNDGRMLYYSRTGELKKEDQVKSEIIPCVAIGELLFGQQWANAQKDQGKFVPFDIVRICDVDVDKEIYAERLKMVRRVQEVYRGTWAKVPGTIYHTEFELVWQRYVETEKYEGLVFRNLQDTYCSTLGRMKQRVTEEYFIIGMEEGQGKHKGRMGALIVSNLPGYGDFQMRVGGGFTDEQRDWFWAKRDLFEPTTGFVITVAGQKRFSSGALRHPNFVGFHAERNFTYSLEHIGVPKEWLNVNDA